MAEPPELRASDADRERVAVRLRDAAGDGQLTLEELDERLQAAYSARTRGDLEPLVADLQATGAEAGPVAHPGGYSVRPGPGGARWLLAIMGGCDRKGRWRLAERATVLNVMGGADLDLNQVELAADRVELTVISVMGGSDIHVPKGLNVEVSEFAFMGGNSIRIEEEHPPAPGPVLHLRIFSLMGGTDVKRGPKLTWAERRELRRTHRHDRRELRRGHRAARYR
jgi:hypothetical protein